MKISFNDVLSFINVTNYVYSYIIYRGTDIISKYLCVNFLIKTSVGDVEYQLAYIFCICKGIFNASKLATLIPLYKKLKRK